MSNFHTKSQKTASKKLMKRNDAVMKFVSDNLKTYDADLTKGMPVDHVARDAFAKLTLTRAQASIPGGVVQPRS